MSEEISLKIVNNSDFQTEQISSTKILRLQLLLIITRRFFRRLKRRCKDFKRTTGQTHADWNFVFNFCRKGYPWDVKFTNFMIHRSKTNLYYALRYSTYAFPLQKN